MSEARPRRSPSKRDFSSRRWFPGTGALPLDLGHRVAGGIQAIPAPLFFALLLALAWLGAVGRPERTGATFVFMLGDWLLVSLLPRFQRSFGGDRSQALALAIARAPFGLLPMPGLILAQLTGTALAIYALWLEPQRLTVTRQSLRSRKLAPGPPLVLVHFGDVHIERITERERSLVKAIEEMRPDLIAFSGDFLSTSYVRDPAAWEACRWLFSQLRAPLGIFVVAGSPAIDRPEILPRLLAGTPVRWLQNERVTLRAGARAIEVIGVTCTHRPFVDAPVLERLLAEAPPGEAPFRILLYHTPDLAPDAAASGIDLQLSGHTHGGQVRLPGYGALVTASLYGKAFEMGRYQVGGMTLFVTRGVGLEGTLAPRVRFLCPPEIVRWELSG